MKNGTIRSMKESEWKNVPHKTTPRLQNAWVGPETTRGGENEEYTNDERPLPQHDNRVIIYK